MPTKSTSLFLVAMRDNISRMFQVFFFNCILIIESTPFCKVQKPESWVSYKIKRFQNFQIIILRYVTTQRRTIPISIYLLFFFFISVIYYTYTHCKAWHIHYYFSFRCKCWIVLNMQSLMVTPQNIRDYNQIRQCLNNFLHLIQCVIYVIRAQ